MTGERDGEKLRRYVKLPANRLPLENIRRRIHSFSLPALLALLAHLANVKSFLTAFIEWRVASEKRAGYVISPRAQASRG